MNNLVKKFCYFDKRYFAPTQFYGVNIFDFQVDGFSVVIFNKRKSLDDCDDQGYVVVVKGRHNDEVYYEDDFWGLYKFFRRNYSDCIRFLKCYEGCELHFLYSKKKIEGLFCEFYEGFDSYLCDLKKSGCYLLYLIDNEIKWFKFGDPSPFFGLNRVSACVDRKIKNINKDLKMSKFCFIDNGDVFYINKRFEGASSINLNIFSLKYNKNIFLYGEGLFDGEIDGDLYKLVDGGEKKYLVYNDAIYSDFIWNDLLDKVPAEIKKKFGDLITEGWCCGFESGEKINHDDCIEEFYGKKYVFFRNNLVVEDLIYNNMSGFYSDFFDSENYSFKKSSYNVFYLDKKHLSNNEYNFICDKDLSERRVYLYVKGNIQFCKVVDESFFYLVDCASDGYLIVLHTPELNAFYYASNLRSLAFIIVEGKLPFTLQEVADESNIFYINDRVHSIVELNKNNSNF